MTTYYKQYDHKKITMRNNQFIVFNVLFPLNWKELQLNNNKTKKKVKYSIEP